MAAWKHSWCPFDYASVPFLFMALYKLMGGKVIDLKMILPLERSSACSQLLTDLYIVTGDFSVIRIPLFNHKVARCEKLSAKVSDFT